MDVTNTSTDSLFLTVFNCGQREINPFCMLLPAPKDVVGSKIELCREMRTIINENKHLQNRHFGDTPLDKIPTKQKKSYVEHRHLLNSRLNVSFLIHSTFKF